MIGDLAGCSVVMVEDDEVFGRALVQRLRLAGVATHWARSAAEGAQLLRRHRPTLVLCDIRLPDGDGEDLLARMMPELGNVPVVAMTAYGGFEQAVRLMRAGVDDYLAKPFPAQRVLEKLAAFARSGGEPRAEEDSAGLLDSPGWRSPPMRTLHAALERVAAADATVLLTGESGAGKGVAARRLRAMAGVRATLPFVVLDCAGLPAETTEAEAALFGRGDAAGLVEAAGAGTLFLDEVGELSSPLQARLLRLLEEHRFQRLGAAEAMATGARFVAATNADLPGRVAAGVFRADLWFRLSVLTLEIAPLRSRPQDTEELAHHFAARFSRGERGITAEGMAALLAHDWPGNVRELRNRIERAVLLAEVASLDVEDLFPERAGGGAAAQQRFSPEAPVEAEEAAVPDILSLADAREAAERVHIRRVLARCGGRIGDAATALGVSRTTLWERMRRLGLSAR